MKAMERSDLDRMVELEGQRDLLLLLLGALLRESQQPSQHLQLLGKNSLRQTWEACQQVVEGFKADQVVTPSAQALGLECYQQRELHWGTQDQVDHLGSFIQLGMTLQGQKIKAHAITLLTAMEADAGLLALPGAQAVLSAAKTRLARLLDPTGNMGQR